MSARGKKTTAGRTLLLLSAAVLLAALAEATQSAPPGEPTARGRTAAEWLKVLEGDGGHATAVSSLAELGGAARPLLLSALKDHASPNVREGAARALGRIGGPGVAEALAAAIRREPASKVAFQTAISLAALGRAGDAQVAAEIPGVIAALEGALGDPQTEVGLAGLALAALGPDGTRALLSNAAPGVCVPERRRALYGLRNAMGDGVEEALVQALGDKAVEVRREASAALGSRAGSSKLDLAHADSVVNALIQALVDPDQSVRFQAVHALPKIGPAARAALPALRAARQDSSPAVAHDAATAIGTIEAIPAAVQPAAARNPSPSNAGETALIDGKTMDEWARIYATGDLKAQRQADAAFAKDDAQARAALRAVATSDPDHRTRHGAMGWFAYRRGPGAAALLAEVARTDPEGWVRASAVKRLAELTAKGDAEARKLEEQLIPELIEAMAKDPSLQGIPVRSLGSLGALATPSLVKAARGHSAANARAGALRALKLIHDPQTAPVVIRGLKDESPVVRRASVEAMKWVVGSEHVDEAVAALAAALKDQDFQVKRDVTYLLIDFGPAGRSALPALRQAAEQDAALRSYAETAIERLQ